MYSLISIRTLSVNDRILLNFIDYNINIFLFINFIILWNT